MSRLNQEIIEGLAILLHNWYLEATSTLNKQSYNENAQKPFSELTEQQKFIDRYIAGKVLEKVKQGAKLREEEIIEMIEKKIYYTDAENVSKFKDLIKKIKGDEK